MSVYGHFDLYQWISFCTFWAIGFPALGAFVSSGAIMFLFVSLFTHPSSLVVRRLRMRFYLLLWGDSPVSVHSSSESELHRAVCLWCCCSYGSLMLLLLCYATHALLLRTNVRASEPPRLRDIRVVSPQARIMSHPTSHNSIYLNRCISGPLSSHHLLS